MKNEQGFSLIEVMVSVIMLGIFLTGLVPFVLGQSGFNSQSERRTEAAMAAQIVMDEYRLEDPRYMPSTGSVGPIEVQLGDRTFDVVTQFCSQSSFCINNNIRHLRVSVIYHGDVLYTGETVFTKLR